MDNEQATITERYGELSESASDIRKSKASKFESLPCVYRRSSSSFDVAWPGRSGLLTPPLLSNFFFFCQVNLDFVLAGRR